jgi:hypothetical protein
MKKTSLLIVLAGFLVAALALPAFAAEKADKDKEVTITGEGKCAKCALHEGEKCQTVIQTEKDGKTMTYYVKENKVSKSFHENVCKGTEKVTATGTVKEHDGKMILTVSKIEVVK